MLSRIERCSSEVSCVTTEICARSDSWVAREMSCPSIKMRPPSRSKKRRSRLITVDLPARERPRVGLVGELQRARDREHALLHHADLLENLRDRERDPARHVGELERER